MFCIHYLINIVIVIYLALPAIQSDVYNSNFEKWINALSRSIDFLSKRPHQNNVDSLLGITITQAQIAAALAHEKANVLQSEHLNMLHNIKNVSAHALSSIISIVVPNSPDVAKVNAFVNDPELWRYPINWKHYDMEATIIKRKDISEQEVIDSMYRGAPTEKESDRCLKELFENRVGDVCPLSDDCVNILFKDDNVNGYSLTHRLLIVLIMNMLQCRTERGENFDYLVAPYCSKIFQNLKDIETTGFPHFSSDLALEEVLFCGLFGYKDFINNHFGDLMINWQQHDCFKAKVSTHNIRRRTSAPMDFGCDGHTTGLAAATLALFIRHEIENS